MADSDFKVTQRQAAEFLDVSTKTISRYRKKGLPFKMILNPVTGKQEVRFRKVDLERWSEGRQLLATFGQEGSAIPPAPKSPPGEPSQHLVNTGNNERSGASDYLADLLEVYKDQIMLLREQLDDMRAQLARRDRQIDDLMRLMVGLQLEYKPDEKPQGKIVVGGTPGSLSNRELKKKFSREELAESVLRLRQKGKAYDEIASGLNQINVATLSGKPYWTEAEVQSLLPQLVRDGQNVIEL